MNIRKAINGMLAVAGIALAAAGSANAQTSIQFASITGSDGSFVYTTGATGGLTLTAPFFASLDRPVAGTIINNPALVSFTGLANSGTTSTGTVGGNTFFSQNLTGGAFMIRNAAGTTTLLSGTFTGAVLSGVLGTNQAGVDTNFFGVVYTGGTYASSAGIALGPNVMDKFNFSLINAQPSLAVTGSFLNSFTSAGNGQFTGAVTAVPEPSTYAAFGIAGFGLLGLMVRGRKTRRMAA